MKPNDSVHLAGFCFLCFCFWVGQRTINNILTRGLTLRVEQWISLDDECIFMTHDIGISLEVTVVTFKVYIYNYTRKSKYTPSSLRPYPSKTLLLLDVDT